MVGLLVVDTGVGWLAIVGDLATAEHNALLGHTTGVVEPSGSECTVFTMMTTVMV